MEYKGTLTSAKEFAAQGKTEGIFELNDGNRRWEAFRRPGTSEYDVIVWITEKTELDQFTERYINN